MALLRVELTTDPDHARRFNERVTHGEPYPRERRQAIDEAWARGYTPTGDVTYRGIGQGRPPTLKFDVEIDIQPDRQPH